MPWPPWKQETPPTPPITSGGAERVPGAYEMERENLMPPPDGTPKGGMGGAPPLLAAVSSAGAGAGDPLAPGGSGDTNAPAPTAAAGSAPSPPIYSMGECENPIRLARSKAVSLDRGTGEVTYADSTYVKPCGNRRAGECAHCSRQHSGDCYSIIQSGLDKKSPFLFVTLTAPGSATGGTGFWVAGNTPPKDCKTCGLPVAGYRPGRVREDDSRIGSPYCLACFDPSKAARWNSDASALWAETILLARRYMRDNCIGDSDDKKLPKIDYVKVIEFQRRGAIHFHGLFRTWKCEAALKYAISKASINGHTWGKVDFQLISPRDESAAKKCVAYLAKYVTKSTRCDDDLRASHLARVADTARAQAPCSCAALRLRNPGETRIVCRVCRAAHEGLGSRSHVLTKSHTWGRSFTDCRNDRRRFHALGVHGPQTALDALLEAASTWKYTGRGYVIGEAWAARRAAEYRLMLARPPSRTEGAPASISAS